MKSFMISLLVCSLLPLTCFGNALEVPEAEEIKDPAIVRIYKGQAAEYDGALLPFNTLKAFVQYRHDYELMKQDYQNYGPIHAESGSVATDKWAFTAMGILSGAVVGVALLSSASPEVKNAALITGSIGIATSIVLLAF